MTLLWLVNALLLVVNAIMWAPHSLIVAGMWIGMLWYSKKALTP